MDKLKIHLKKESFYINNAKSVIGVICFSTNDFYFPGKAWDDFVVVVLYWLTRELIELTFNKEKIAESPFMEGCFKVAFSLDAEEKCTIHFIEGEKLVGDEEIVHKTIVVPFEEVKREVKKACEILLEMKETKELDFEEDYEELKESYELLCTC